MTGHVEQPILQGLYNPAQGRTAPPPTLCVPRPDFRLRFRRYSLGNQFGPR
jgi:hypothetical protein